MISLNSNVLNQYASESREIAVRLTFNDTYKVDGDYVKSLTIDDSIISGETLSLGNACSAKLELDMYLPSSSGYTYTDLETGQTTTYSAFASLSNAKINVEIGIKVNNSYVFTQMGVFFVDSYTTKNDFLSVSIVAYDAMLKIDKALGNHYTCTLNEANPTVMNVLKNILTQAGISTSGIGYYEAQSGRLNLVEKTYDSNGVASSDSKAISNAGANDALTIQSSAPEAITITVTCPNYVVIQDYPSTLRILYFTDANRTELFDIVTENIYDNWEETPMSVVGTMQIDSNIPESGSPLYISICVDTLDDDASTLYTIDYSIPAYSINFNGVNADVTIPNPYTVDVSARTILGYMAGIMGCNAKVNRYGNLVLKPFTDNTSTSISRDVQYMGGFDINNQNALTVGYVTTGSEPNGEGQGGRVTVGSGTFGFNFENPFINLINSTTPASAVQNILTLYSGMTFYVGNVKYRCNPAIDCGDIIAVKDKSNTNRNIIVLNNKISLEGGLSARISCDIDSNATKDFVSIPSTKKLTSAFSDFVQKYQDIVRVLLGVSGGYVKFVKDANSNIRAIAITQRDIAVEWYEYIEEGVTKGKVVVLNSSDNTEPMWVWSYGGLSFTNNGGTSYEIAMTMEGRVYANEVVSAKGSFGNFTIDDASLTEAGGFFADYYPKNAQGELVDGTAYRVFIQPAYGNNPSETWVFSTQTAEVSNGIVGEFGGNFTIKANGDLTCQELTCNGASVGGSLSVDDDLSVGGDLSADDVSLSGDLSVTGKINFPKLLSTGDYVNFYDFSNALNESGLFLQIDYGSYRLYNGDPDPCYRSKINASGGLIVSANDGNNLLILDASSVRLHTQDNLPVGAIGVNASGQIVTATGSAKKYKENIKETLDDILDPHRLYELPIKQFNIKEKYKEKFIKADTQIGIVADDVDKFYPNACVYSKDGEVEGWNDRVILSAMLKLIQEQKKDIDELKERVSKLEGMINASDRC